ncbi:signal peptidase II [Chelativorans composti]|jgi:lipoprotein signal peptidase|uniref:Lipoprotein signal peptidase n=1 Tax=Chelativorans composti TaxID=768533 RepID=A0ABW5DJH7_9HYPH|nr:signal peptidase II [bacterium SGD-2]
MRRSTAWFIFTVVAAVVFDQAIKLWVETNMPLHSRIDLIPFLSLLHTQNTGIAFSFLSDLGSPWLGVIAIAIIVFVAVLAFRTDPHQIYARTGFALIIGGAIGNLIDRLIGGYVVDYVYFHTPVWSFAIFNLADAFITVGAGLVIFQEFLVWRQGRSANRASE